MYFDPGMGSLVIQAIIAIFAVGGGYLAIAKTKIGRLFGKKKEEKTEIEKKNNIDADGNGNE